MKTSAMPRDFRELAASLRDTRLSACQVRADDLHVDRRRHAQLSTASTRLPEEKNGVSSGISSRHCVA